MKKRTHWLRNILWLTAWAVVLVAVWQWRWLRDEYVLRTYQPRPDVVQLLEGVELTSAGLAALYRSDPIIDDKLSFAQHCPTESAGLELGCYDGGHIFILRIDNNQLAPEMKAVLVHEMLHAVWADLPANRRQELTDRVQYYYQQEATQDIDLVERMAGYTETEPGEESNELHSILGSEQAELPVSLEEHYSLYIGNRMAIVGYHEQYSAVFEKQLSELEKELAAISSDKVTLEALNNRMTSLRNAGKIAEYNALVPQQNRLVVAINARIDTYSQAVADYNALSVVLDAQSAPELVAPVK